MSDLIRRSDAIEEVARRDTTDGTVKVYSGREVIEILHELPSADQNTELISKTYTNGFDDGYAQCRQDAIDAFMNDVTPYGLMDDEGNIVSGCKDKDVIAMLYNLPSAQADIIRCKDCKWKNKHNCTRAVEVFIYDDCYCSWAERKDNG